MGDVVNLNRFRKARQRTEKQATAAENRTRFGRSAAKRKADALARDKAESRLDGKKIEDKE